MYEVNPEDDIFVEVLDDKDQVLECLFPDLDLKIVDPSDVECWSTGSVVEAWQFEFLGWP